jgi:hypothetical protein
VTHEFIRELYKSDVSRVKGVTPWNSQFKDVNRENN